MQIVKILYIYLLWLTIVNQYNYLFYDHRISGKNRRLIIEDKCSWFWVGYLEAADLFCNIHPKISTCVYHWDSGLIRSDAKTRECYLTYWLGCFSQWWLRRSGLYSYWVQRLWFIVWVVCLESVFFLFFWFRLQFCLIVTYIDYW